MFPLPVAQVPLPDAVSGPGPTPAPLQTTPQVQPQVCVWVVWVWVWGWVGGGWVCACIMAHPPLLSQDKKGKDAKPAEKKPKTNGSVPKKEKVPPAQEGGEH